jgi:regulator of replication initiation timing
MSGNKKAAADVSGLVERLSRSIDRCDILALWATIQTLSESNAALEAENGRLRDVLEMISNMHDSNPPLPLADMPELDYARRTLSTMRWEARAALSSPKGVQDHG